VQLDPSEDETFAPGNTRAVFRAGDVVFGLAICHEGWRYPETVRFAAQHGAHVVFIPHFHEAEPGSYRPTTFADPANTFHEKAIVCRAAENTCFVAAVNYASDGSPTTSAVVGPDGTVRAWQPYGHAGLLIVDIDTSEATGLLASRFKAESVR
jgi:predicted amidohydrolase